MRRTFGLHFAFGAESCRLCVHSGNLQISAGRRRVFLAVQINAAPRDKPGSLRHCPQTNPEALTHTSSVFC